MSDDNKDKIKVIDINNDNFFTEAESHFDRVTKPATNDDFLVKLVVVAVLLSFLLIVLVVFVPLEKVNETKLGKTLKSNESAISVGHRSNLDIFKKRENILFLGVDSNGPDSDPFKDTRTDTIMLASLDNTTKTVNVISIPRDSKVYINGHGIDKINSAHAIGGIDLTIDTVEEMFGIKVDHYVLLNFDGLKEIISILGTIPVTVDKKLRYHDYAGNLHIKLDPGKQELDAKQVEQFARFRHDAVGDIGRVERQRMIMKGIISKIQSPESITKLPEIISTTGNYIKTDMTIFDMTRYAGVAKSINIDDVIVATLPGQPSQNSYISYWILEPDKVQSIIDRLVYRLEKDNPLAEPIKVSLYYDEKTTERLDAIKEILTDSNMEIVCENQTNKTTSEIIAHNDKVTLKKYKYLKTILPQLKKTHMTLSYENLHCGASDLTLILTEPKGE